MLSVGGEVEEDSFLPTETHNNKQKRREINDINMSRGWGFVSSVQHLMTNIFKDKHASCLTITIKKVFLFAFAYYCAHFFFFKCTITASWFCIGEYEMNDRCVCESTSYVT